MKDTPAVIKTSFPKKKINKKKKKKKKKLKSMYKKTQSGNWGNKCGCHNQRQDKNVKPPCWK